jgi:hypothetical protein
MYYLRSEDKMIFVLFSQAGPNAFQAIKPNLNRFIQFFDTQSSFHFNSVNESINKDLDRFARINLQTIMESNEFELIFNDQPTNNDYWLENENGQRFYVSQAVYDHFKAIKDNKTIFGIHLNGGLISNYWFIFFIIVVCVVVVVIACVITFKINDKV